MLQVCVKRNNSTYHTRIRAASSDPPGRTVSRSPSTAPVIPSKCGVIAEYEKAQITEQTRTASCTDTNLFGFAQKQGFAHREKSPD
jgi:hypothetical protein